MIKFSIITVCLNAGDDLKYTVENVLGQDYGDFELIVKDGFSTDGSVEKLPKDERIKLIVQKDSGIYDAMNQAIMQANGDYLVFMNAGDGFYNETILQTVADCISENEAVMYYGRCYNDTLQVYSNSPLKVTPFFCYRSMICHQAMIFERRYIQEKLYDCTYCVSADRELLLYTVVKKKLPTRYIPCVIARYKGAGFCETKSNQKRIIEENQRLKEAYFCKTQQWLYALMYKATLPGIRKYVASNPRFVKVYKKAIGIVYRNK